MSDGPAQKTFHTVARVGDIPAGEGRSYAVEGRMVGVFFYEDEYFALDDFCPHMGASLAGGHVENHAVYCPWHAWKFSIRDGLWLDNPKAECRSECFEVRLHGDEIQVHVPAKPEAEIPTNPEQSTAERTNDHESDSA